VTDGILGGIPATKQQKFRQESGVFAAATPVTNADTGSAAGKASPIRKRQRLMRPPS
jgi:hypothetical protein